MKAFLIQRWFLVGLVLVLILGITYADALQPIAELRWLRDGCVAAVMFCMSLPLEARAMLRSLRKPGPPLLAVFVTFGILPLFAWAISLLLRGDLGPGLQVAAATPCTLASASVWTRKAGGNDAVSTLVTLITNSICVFVTPFWLWIMTGSMASHAELSVSKMTMQLGLLVVLPILVAQIIRLQPAIAQFATRRKVPFGVAAQAGILIMIFLGAIRTGLRLQEQSSPMNPLDIGVMLIAVLVVHLAMFWLAVELSKLCRYSREDQIAVGFSASQKTLMVGLLMAMTLKASILPMVAYHCLQLFVDTLIADGYRKRTEQANSADAQQAVSASN